MYARTQIEALSELPRDTAANAVPIRRAVDTPIPSRSVIHSYETDISPSAAREYLLGFGTRNQRVVLAQCLAAAAVAYIGTCPMLV